ncbi:hypothetical protein [Williamsia muralis]|uniref:DUF2567 domain-containing protein n=1 Tax=Williamsia marianensis TaxID=85044 RepID=A0ABU4ENN1_WILMA|nr:hypothetical protein [Williamsia muralis]MDV7132850.1 hypothetical protein [Williamsia muralis]
MTPPDPIPPRPRPARPEIRIEPLHEPIPDERPRVLDIAAAVWLLTLIALVVTAAMVGFDQADVRAELTDSLAEDNLSATPEELADTVKIAMIASGVVAFLVLACGLFGILRLRDRVPSSRSLLATIGVIAVIGAVAFWTVIDPARDVLGAAAGWLPLAVAAGAAVATALLFAPAISRWLKAAPIRR